MLTGLSFCAFTSACFCKVRPRRPKSNAGNKLTMDKNLKQPPYQTIPPSVNEQRVFIINKGIKKTLFLIFNITVAFVVT